MSHLNENVTVIENELFSTLVITFEANNSNILWGTNMKIQEIIRNFSISPKNIFSIKVTQVNSLRKIEIEYSKFDLLSITSIEDTSKKIIEILNLLGLPKEKIKNIDYKPDISEFKTCIVHILEHCDCDKKFFQKNHKTNISALLSKILGFSTIVLIY